MTTHFGTLFTGIKVVVTLWLLSMHNCPANDELVLDRDNIVVTKSVCISPGEYIVSDADGDGVLHVNADNVVIDFQGATLAAVDPAHADLSEASGLGISVAGARNVTIRNAKIHGYFFNIKAVDAPGLRLEDCDVSFSRAQRIASEAGPIAIWIHLRSLEAWRGYGAGIWIEGSDRCTVHDCRGGGAQNGLLLVRCNDSIVTECDFSFNSGFGVGLWESSSNVVAWNLIDFVNRPWGGGWGGDSAALVIVNDCHENYIVGNSMTHGGDGLFLTDLVNGGIDARNQKTNFRGSCNNNVIAYNDGSWSPHNAYEGTFSFGNIYYRNFANDSHYGFWLGYSGDSLLLENEVLHHRADGIAIEQGAGTRIEGNTFTDIRGAAIALWSRGGWIDKLHPSRDIDIRNNVIRKCGRAYRLDNSTDVSVGGDTVEGATEAAFDYLDRPSTQSLARFQASPQYERLQQILEARPSDFRMLRDQEAPKGIAWLQADAFSPRDYRGQLVAWRRTDAASLELLPLVPDKLSFSTPDWISVAPVPDSNLYTATTKQQAGPGESKPYTIEIRNAAHTQTLRGAFLTAVWDVAWFRWDKPDRLAYDDAHAWAALFDSEPIQRQTTRELSKNLWTGGFPGGVPHSHFAILARTTIKLAGGRYQLTTVSDDGIRVFLDGREVISRWNHHGPTRDQTEVAVSAGVHEFTVHYCQEGGASALSLAWQRLGE